MLFAVTEFDWFKISVDCTPPFEVYFHTNSIGDTGIASTTVTVSRGIMFLFLFLKGRGRRIL
jgi:hypothetical protein